jgi:FAD/FMN-containing dehydrogenase
LDEHSGYPYPPVKEGYINLAPVLAGSEGTLAVIRQAVVRLVPREKDRVLCVLGYSSIPEACDAVPELLEHYPAAIELIPESLVLLAKAIPAYAHQLGFVDQITRGDEQTPTMLAVEFTGENRLALESSVSSLIIGKESVYVAWSPVEQQRVWSVRKAGLAILMSRAGDVKPLAFIEDLSVPVERLGEFVREMERILCEYETTGDFYAHASAVVGYSTTW